MKKLSIIVPAYNEERRLPDTLLHINSTLSKQSFDYEIIVVNDGSHDNTAGVVADLKVKITKLSFMDNKENHGKGFVVRQGMLAGSGDIRLFMDADNSTHVSEVLKMLPYFDQGFDVVVGSRVIAGSNIKVKQTRVRAILGNVLRFIVHTIIPLGIVDSQCGFKVFTKHSVELIFPKQSVFGWAFDIEVLAIAKKNKLKIKEVPVTWVNSEGGGASFLGMIKILFELLKIRLNFW